MSSFIVNMKVFNEILGTFFEYLESEFPDFKSDIILTRAGVELVKRNNPRLVVERFINMVDPFRKQIARCDEQFFLNFNLDPNHNGLGDENTSLCIKVKNIWLCPTTTDTQKAHIWLYFQKLIKISDKIKG